MKMMTSFNDPRRRDIVTCDNPSLSHARATRMRDRSETALSADVYRRLSVDTAKQIRARR